MKNLRILLLLLCVLTLTFGSLTPAFAAGGKTITDTIGISGGSSSGDIKADLKKNFQDVVDTVRMVGLLICLICLLISGVLFATSGQNPTKRSGAFAFLIGVGCGIFVIMQAEAIANYFGTIGNGT